MGKGIVLLAALCALIAAPPAQARHRMTFEFAQMVAGSYWAKRGVTVPCHPREELLSWEETLPWLQGHSPIAGGAPEMMASVPTCTVDVTPWANAWRKDGDPEIRADYCWDIVHEVGHLAGLEHPDQPGISDAMRKLVSGTVMDSTNGAPYPYGCEHPGKFLRRRAHLARRHTRR